jgi:hypothetical protein
MKAFRPVLASIAFVALALIVLPSQAGQISGSAHDFSTQAWTGASGTPGSLTGGKICVACHTPHNSNTAVSPNDAPLWNHATSTATYTLYSTQTFLQRAGGVAQPGGNSKLCLSCHDGSIAVDSFGGTFTNSGSTTISNANNLMTDLSNDHPIGVDYSTVRTNDLTYPDHNTTSVTIGSSPSKTGLMKDLLLYNGKVECSSCHDVHNTYTVVPAGATPTTTGMVKMAAAGSTLCLACHKK